MMRGSGSRATCINPRSHCIFMHIRRERHGSRNSICALVIVEVFDVVVFNILLYPAGKAFVLECSVHCRYASLLTLIVNNYIALITKGLGGQAV